MHLCSRRIWYLFCTCATIVRYALHVACDIIRVTYEPVQHSSYSYKFECCHQHEAYVVVGVSIYIYSVACLSIVDVSTLAISASSTAGTQRFIFSLVLRQVRSALRTNYLRRNKSGVCSNPLRYGVSCERSAASVLLCDSMSLSYIFITFSRLRCLVPRLPQPHTQCAIPIGYVASGHSGIAAIDDLLYSVQRSCPKKFFGFQILNAVASTCQKQRFSAFTAGRILGTSGGFQLSSCFCCAWLPFSNPLLHFENLPLRCLLHPIGVVRDLAAEIKALWKVLAAC